MHLKNVFIEKTLTTELLFQPDIILCTASSSMENLDLRIQGNINQNAKRVKQNL